MTPANRATVVAVPKHDDAGLPGPLLTLARLAVVAYGGLFSVLFVLGVPFRYQALATVCTPVESCRALYLSPLEVAALPAWLSLEAYAVFQIAIEVVLMTASFTVAALILYRRSHTRMGLLAATVTIWIGTTLANVIATMAEEVPAVGVVYWPLAFGGLFFFWLFVLVFPDGRIEPPWLGRRAPLVVLAALGIVILSIFQAESAFLIVVTEIIFFGFVGFPLAIQVLRYRRYASAVQRQQVKWGLVGMVGMVIGFALWSSIEPVTNPFAGGAPRLTWYLLGMALTLTAAALFPISLGYAILRHRLWDIDRVINRALVYGALTVTLTSIYVGTIVVLQQVVLSGRQSPLVVAGSTLLIAALFAPLRRRIQAFIDRRFYRSKYDSRQALEAFAATARSQVDLDALTAELLRVVGDTMQPQQVGVWLRPDSERPRQRGPDPTQAAS